MRRKQNKIPTANLHFLIIIILPFSAFYTFSPPMCIIDVSSSTDADRKSGLTLVELLLVIAIIGTLMMIAIPTVQNMLHKARIMHACSDILRIGQKITNHLYDYGTLPEQLSGFPAEDLIDPWGNPYQYLAIFGKAKNDIKGKWRKDRFLVPINADFDLYSMGEDGKTVAPITAKASHDDIIRANNGDYVGLVSKY